MNIDLNFIKKYETILNKEIDQQKKNNILNKSVFIQLFKTIIFSYNIDISCIS